MNLLFDVALTGNCITERWSNIHLFIVRGRRMNLASWETASMAFDWRISCRDAPINSRYLFQDLLRSGRDFWQSLYTDARETKSLKHIDSVTRHGSGFRALGAPISRRPCIQRRRYSRIHSFSSQQPAGALNAAEEIARQRIILSRVYARTTNTQTHTYRYGVSYNSYLELFLRG